MSQFVFRGALEEVFLPCEFPFCTEQTNYSNDCQMLGSQVHQIINRYQYLPIKD